MIKSLFLFVALAFIGIKGNSQILDSAGMTRILEKGNKQIVSAISNQTKELKDSILAPLSQANKASLKPNKAMANLITLLPAIFFALIITIVVVKLRRDNVKLSDFLIDKETQISLKKELSRIAEANSSATIAAANAIRANAPAYAAANIAPPEIPAPPVNQDTNTKPDTSKEQSTSRLIAFISGLTSVAIAVCIATFYFYKSFLGEANVSVGNLANILYGLGLGVIPYGFNKISSALK